MEQIFPKTSLFSDDLVKRLFPDGYTEQMFPTATLFSEDFMARVVPKFNIFPDGYLEQILPKFDLIPNDCFKDFLPKIDFEPMLRRLREALPPNWGGDLLDVDKVNQVINVEGIPLAWVPRIEIIHALFEAPDRASRIAILVEHREGVSNDCRAAISGIKHPKLGGQLPLILRALDAFDEGHVESAMALATVATETAVNRRFAVGYNKVREQVIVEFEDLAITSMRLHMALAPLAVFYTPWWANSGNPKPAGVSRHVSVHFAHVDDYTESNALLVLMIAASVLRGLEEAWDITDPVDDGETSAEGDDGECSTRVTVSITPQRRRCPAEGAREACPGLSWWPTLSAPSGMLPARRSEARNSRFATRVRGSFNERHAARAQISCLCVNPSTPQPRWHGAGRPRSLPAGMNSGGSMDQTFNLRGRWWLPHHEDHQVFGSLTWDANDGGTLHLHDELPRVVWLDNVLADGSVQRYRADRGEFQRTYPLIFGRVENRAYTLLDSFRLSAREYDEDDRIEKVHVNRFLEGAWFDDADELRVDRVVVDMRHLTGWVNHSGFEVAWPRVDGTDEDVFAVVTAKTLPPFTTEHDGASLRIFQGLGGTGDHVHDLGVSQSWSVRLQQAQPEPLDTFLDTASDFQDLVSVAVGKTAQYESVVLHHPDVPLLSVGGTPIKNLRHDITYYIRWSNRCAPCEPVKGHDMYFTFDDLGGIDGVGRWLAVAADYRTELRRVLATRYREDMVLEDRIMNVSAALDSFDMHRRGTGKWVGYAKRIEHCVNLAGQPFLDLIVIDRGQWVERVVNTRDDLAHHRERFRTEGSVGDHLLTEQLFWLFVLCMLRLAHAPDPIYERIGKHPQIRWLTERADASGRQSS